MSYTQLDCIKNSNLIQNNEIDIIDNIPDKYKKLKVVDNQIIISNNEDLYNTIECLRFHMVNELPYEIIEYIKTHDVLVSKYNDFFHDKLVSAHLEFLISTMNDDLLKKTKQSISYTRSCIKGKNHENIIKTKPFNYDKYSNKSQLELENLLKQLNISYYRKKSFYKSSWVLTETSIYFNFGTKDEIEYIEFYDEMNQHKTYFELQMRDDESIFEDDENCEYIMRELTTSDRYPLILTDMHSGYRRIAEYRIYDHNFKIFMKNIGLKNTTAKEFFMFLQEICEFYQCWSVYSVYTHH